MQPNESPLRQYLHILRRQWWLVALVPAVAMAATLAILALQKPTYRAATTLVVGEPRGAAPPVLGSHSVTRTMTTLLQSDLVARSVIRNLDLDVSRALFGEKLNVGVLPDTSVLDVSYTSTSRKEALAVVNDITRIFTRRLEATLGITGGANPGNGSFDLIVRAFDPPHVAVVPASKLSPVVFAGLGGLVLGFLLAVGRETLSSPIQRRADAEEWFGVPVVGTLPKVERSPPGIGVGGGGGRLSRLGGDAARVASLDLLRARLQFAKIGVVGPTIMVTSAGSEVDTSPVTASLGAALTWAGNRVVCVDADFSSPSLHSSLGLAGDGPGLIEVLEKGLPLERALVKVDLVQPASDGAGPSKPPGTLELLSAGGPTTTLVGLLTPAAVTRLVLELYERVDYIVFDCPSLLVADALPVAVHSDNVLVVARRGRTTRTQAESVRETLQGLGIANAGVVLTDTPVGDGYV